jgi:hydroxylamine dehydrogenase
MITGKLVPLVLLALTAVGPAVADDCLDCHRLKTPAAVRQWEGSAHAKAKVGCADCHGSDHGRIDRKDIVVDQKVCGRCHGKALKEHAASRHGMGLHSGWGCTRNLPGRDQNECRHCHEEGSARPLSQVHCARFLKQSSEMGELGCNRCHNVESSCASCHTNHGTDLKLVRDPNVCASCHMGPDHPQWEMWQTSRHGTLFTSGGPDMGPTCQSCHMVRGSHDVSSGITMSSGGVPYPEPEARKGREEMLQLCITCHSRSFARTELARGDAIRTQSLAILKEAEQVVNDLADRNLLDPMPDKRPPHPLSGPRLVLDNQMLYEDTSHIERLFFKMKKYDYARTVKGAYHQNAAYTHWYGNAELKMDLTDIKAEANRLRERGSLHRAAPTGQSVTPAAAAEEELRVLKKKAERGELSQNDYEREKARVLRGMDGKAP